MGVVALFELYRFQARADLEGRRRRHLQEHEKKRQHAAAVFQPTQALDITPRQVFGKVQRKAPEDAAKSCVFSLELVSSAENLSFVRKSQRRAASSALSWC